MKLKNILDNLFSKTDISKLNTMQQVMADVTQLNIVLLAPTGSGKTLAFALYLLQRLSSPNGSVQAIVMAPSRELVIQVHSVLRPLATGLKVAALYGGHSMTDEVNTLSVAPDLIIATPGRLLDHLQRRQLDLSSVKTLVIDEYDKALELGFSDEMTRIVKRLKSLKHTVLTSATELEQLPGFLPVDDVETLDFRESVQAPRHRMQVVLVESPDRDKLDTLLSLLHSLDNCRVIVFVNHRDSAERVYDALRRDGFPVGLYHGGLEQRLREQAIDLLDNGTTPVLVATDLAARGLDIDNIGAVIHYHMPTSAEAWTHRNGRTARQDATGTIYVIKNEADNLPEYITVDRQYAPSGRSNDPIHSDVSTLYINAGRREKISRGDIAGFFMKQGGLRPDQVGRINVSDHSSIVAVPREIAKDLMKQLSPLRLKNKRVKISIVTP